MKIGILSCILTAEVRLYTFNYFFYKGQQFTPTPLTFSAATTQNDVDILAAEMLQLITAAGLEVPQIFVTVNQNGPSTFFSIKMIEPLREVAPGEMPQVHHFNVTAVPPAPAIPATAPVQIYQYFDNSAEAVSDNIEFYLQSKS